MKSKFNEKLLFRLNKLIWMYHHICHLVLNSWHRSQLHLVVLNRWQYVHRSPTQWRCVLHIVRGYPQYVCNKFRVKKNQTPSQSVSQSVSQSADSKLLINHNQGNNSYFDITRIITFNLIKPPFQKYRKKVPKSTGTDFKVPVLVPIPVLKKRCQPLLLTLILVQLNRRHYNKTYKSFIIRYEIYLKCKIFPFFIRFFGYSNSQMLNCFWILLLIKLNDPMWDQIPHIS